jgi:hypothetical protein
MFERYATALIRDYASIGAGFTYEMGDSRYETVEEALAGYTADHGERAADPNAEAAYRIVSLDRRDRPESFISIPEAREIAS